MACLPLHKIVFPVAGMGTRFLPATKATPKEMMTIVDKPLIQYGVEEALAAGMEDVIMVTGRGKRAIEDHFDVSAELEHNLVTSGKHALYQQISEISRMVNVAYVRQKEPLGLGHAVLCAKDWVGADEAFAVSLADELMLAQESPFTQMRRVYEQTGCSVIGLAEVAREKVSSYGIAAVQDEDGLMRITHMVEKPALRDAPSNLAMMGRYIFTPRLFAYLDQQQPGAQGEVQLTDAMTALAQDEPVYGVIIEGERFDAGNPLGFVQANIAVGMQHPEYRDDLVRFLRQFSI